MAARKEANFVIDTAKAEDFAQIKDIFFHVIDEGETYSYETDELSDEWVRKYWLDDCVTTLVAREDGVVAGVAAIRYNRTGRADHVANASFIVHHEHRGHGIGKALGKAAIAAATDKGFKAMQYNYVVSTNSTAVALWQSLGFQIVGTLPKGFQHAKHGLVDVYVMHRFLGRSA